MGIKSSMRGLKSVFFAFLLAVAHFARGLQLVFLLLKLLIYVIVLLRDY